MTSSSDNSICMLFQRHAKIGKNKIFSTYGNAHSVSDLSLAVYHYIYTSLFTIKMVVQLI